MSIHTRSITVFFICILLTACASAVPAPADAPTPADSGGDYWPTADWIPAAPEAVSIDRAALAQLAGSGEAMNLHSLLVIRGGKLVSETYYSGYDARTLHELYSVTKSFTATLVGIAIDQGKLAGVESPVLDLLPASRPEDAAKKEGITLEHMLTMTAGLDWEEGDPAYRAMYVSPDWTRYVMDLPVRALPGSEFNYCSGCSHVIAAAVQQAVGENLSDFAEKNLFAPLGIENYTWEVDAQNIPIGGWGLKLTPRDMAKLGFLYLHKGSWDGRQIVSTAWVETAVSPHVNAGLWSYGYQWWIDDLHAAYAARGRFGQLIYVVPDLDLIVVSTAGAEDDTALIEKINAVLIPAVKP
jgi:CubicO group peptidase (beta-lactamase class C family)